jgi:biopolymer transport protein ExbB
MKSCRATQLLSDGKQPSFWSRLRAWLAPLVGLVLVHGAALAQEAAEAAADDGGHGNKSVFETIKESGPLVMGIWVVIVLTSVVMMSFIVQGVMTLRKTKLAPPSLVAQLRGLMAGGDYQGAWTVCSKDDSYMANVVQATLTRVGRGKEAVEAAIIEYGQREQTVMKTRNSYLSVIGVVSPMIGLLGTVIGMIGAFAVLGSTGISDPRALASRIGEVLLATASGLFIAIPAFVFYYVFRNMMQACVVHSDEIIQSLFEEVPFASLDGVRIGDGGGSAMYSGVSEGIVAAAVAQVQTLQAAPVMPAQQQIPCPVCQAPVTPGVPSCGHCGSTLNWG